MLIHEDPDSYTRMEITVCLPCADGDCQTCYGEGCECRCLGNEVGKMPEDINQIPRSQWCAGLPDRRPGTPPTCSHGSFSGHWVI